MSWSRGLKVPKRLGQRAITLLTGLHLIDRDLMIMRQEGTLIIPLRPSRSTIDDSIRHFGVLDEFELVKTRFAIKRRRVRSLVDALSGVLPPEQMCRLPKSMDIIGKVAIIRLHPGLTGWKYVVGNAIIRVNPNVETVLVKTSKIEGEHRLRMYEIIAGEPKTATVHREHGCIFHLDPLKVYFSPRLSEERRRVADQVRSGETVIDMFASVGAFAIQIGKRHPCVTVYAIDHNRYAYQFLQTNIHVNRVHDTVFPILGDVRSVTSQFTNVADRVIVDLPDKAFEFVDVACRVLKSGGIIHLYCFTSEYVPIERVLERLRRRVSQEGRSLYQVTRMRRVKSIAPRSREIVLDAVVR